MIYFKIITRDNIMLLLTQNEMNLHYIFFIKLIKEFIIKMNNDANKSFNINILLQ